MSGVTNTSSTSSLTIFKNFNLISTDMVAQICIDNILVIQSFLLRLTWCKVREMPFINYQYYISKLTIYAVSLSISPNLLYRNQKKNKKQFDIQLRQIKKSKNIRIQYKSMQKLNEQQEYEIQLQTKEKYNMSDLESKKARQLLMEEKQMDQALGHCQVQGNRQFSYKCKEKQGNIQGYEEGGRGRKQMDGFFSDLGADRKSSRGSHIFKRTYSFYQQQQQTQQKPLSPKQAQPPTSMLQLQPLPTNKYTKYIESSKKLLKYLRIGYYMHVIRFLFIILVYYNLDFIQTYSNVNSKNGKKNNTSSNDDSNNSNNNSNDNDNDKNYFLPWNAMIYILSGSIDFISIIGYISSIKLLRSDIKVLEARHKIQAEKLERERQQKYLKKSAHHIVEQIQMAPAPLQQPLAQAQNQIPLILRIGPEQTYSCVYSCLRAYKYKNRDQAASFKISKVMHIGATFLFFGRMALEQLLQYQLQSEGSAIIVEAALWVFLVLAFLGVFQVDLFVIESSTGPHIKIQKFCYGKIEQVYKQFWQWRKCYAAILSIGIVVSALWIIFECIKTGLKQNKTNQLTSIMFILCILCFISSISILYIIRKRLQSSKSYMKQLPQTLQKKDENSENTFHEQKSLQKMIIHKDLSLLGILNKYSCGADKYVYSINRVVLLLYGLALLRQVGIENVGDADDMSGYLAIFGFLVAAELYKFVVLIRSKINLLDSCKYSQLNGSQNTSQIQNKEANPEVSSCSICLVQYSAQEKVVVLCCGHIFHEQCLLDWLKQKKQCPFCRYNISEYYEQASF